MPLSLKDRIGVDIGRRAKLEDGLAWAARNDVFYIDIQLDYGANAMETFDERRCELVKKLCRDNRIHLGLRRSADLDLPSYSNLLDLD